MKIPENTSKPVKVQIAKAMKELDRDYTEIAKTLGISKHTAQRYVAGEYPEAWNRYGANVQRLIVTQENKLLAEVVTKLRTDLPDAKYNEALEVYKTLKDSKTSNKSNINIVGNEMNVEFIATGDSPRS